MKIITRKTIMQIALMDQVTTGVVLQGMESRIGIMALPIR
jgi:hypothetical protein